jgi:hypothetical protein
MMKTIVWVTLFVLANQAQSAQITSLQGPVSFNGKPVAAGAILKEAGDLETGPGGKAVVLLSENASGGKSEISLSPASKLRIEAGETARAYFLLEGTVRARLKDKVSKGKFQLRTASAVIGVRGTDFLAVFNPLLSESEIVVFDGRVVFGSSKNAAISKEISKGYWGGIGGRFGKNIAPLILLPHQAFEHFDKASQF